MVAELLERLDLHEVTLVQNDHAAALALAAEEPEPERVARLVISSCEAFDNYPPGLPGKNARLTALMPGGIFLAMQAMRLRALRRLPISLGWMSKRPLPDELVDRWLRPLQTNRGVRRDLRKYARSARRRSSCGRPRIACSAQSMDGAWPSCSPTRGWSRSPTATR